MLVDRNFYVITGLSLEPKLFEKFIRTESTQVTMQGKTISVKLLYHIKHMQAHICLVILVHSKAATGSKTWNMSDEKRFAILFEEGAGTREKASRITDAISSILSVLSPFKPTEDLGVLQLSKPYLEHGLLHIEINKIVKEKGTANTIHSEDELDLLRDIRGYVMLPDYITEKCFSCLPVVAASPVLFDACHFYRESVSDFDFLGDVITEVVQEPEKYPERKELQVKAETAVHNAYKSIEAIVGEPGGNELKNRERLKDWGIDPDKLVGFGGKRVPILSKLLLLQELRDSATAHGKKRRKSPVTYYEIMDAQYLAQTVVLEAINHEESLYVKQ